MEIEKDFDSLVVHRIKELGDLPNLNTIECGQISRRYKFVHNWDNVTCKRCLLKKTR